MYILTLDVASGKHIDLIGFKFSKLSFMVPSALRWECQYSSSKQNCMDSVLIIKIVSALLYPLGLALVFSILWLLFKLLRRRLISRLCALSAFLTLLLASNPMIANRLASSLESNYMQTEIEDVKEYDVIVVLGGGLRLPLPPAKHVQLGHASDRYWYATRLYRAGKAQRIIIAGGNVYPQGGFASEAEFAKQLLVEWGVPEEVIVIETESRTTAQNQENLESLIVEQEIESVLLVTSALHMPRSMRLFSQMPVNLTPAAADVLVRKKNVPKILKWLPSANALRLTTVSLHEYYGMWFIQILRELNALKLSFWCPSCTTHAINSVPN